MRWQDKYTHWLQGAAAGVFVVMAGGLYQGSIMTWGSAKEQAEAAAAVAVLPFCVKDVMADSTAAAELKVKRTHDYDDVVRDYRQRSGALANQSFQFNRDCGKAIEAMMAKSASKS
jgi:hypothetical protein